MSLIAWYQRGAWTDERVACGVYHICPIEPARLDNDRQQFVTAEWYFKGYRRYYV